MNPPGYLWYFIVLPVCILLSSCAQKPVQRGKDSIQSIQLRYDAGMMPQYYSLYLSADSCHYETGRINNPSPDRTVFRLSSQEWKELVSLFEKENIAGIRTRKEERIYDRGGITLRIDYPASTVQVSDAGHSFIVDEDRDRWKTATDRLNSIIERYKK